MTECNWYWKATELVNLRNAPTDDWKDAYHWLSDEWHGEVVVKINGDLEPVAYLCEVEYDDD